MVLSRFSATQRRELDWGDGEQDGLASPALVELVCETLETSGMAPNRLRLTTQCCMDR